MGTQSLSIGQSSNVSGLFSSNATYATARAGSGVVGSSVVGASFGGAVYNLYEYFIEFDTSALTHRPIHARIEVIPQFVGSTDGGTYEARVFDYGASVTAGDWVAGASLAALPLAAQTPTITLAFLSGYNVSGSPLPFNSVRLEESIVLGGNTRVVFCHSSVTNNSAPTGANEWSPSGVFTLKLTLPDKAPIQSSHPRPALRR